MPPGGKKTDEEKAFLANRVSATVTCKLSRICHSEAILDEIRRSATVMKQCQLEAWHLVNVHVLRCLAENLPLPSFDQTFFYRCCAGVMKAAEDDDRKAQEAELARQQSTSRSSKRLKASTTARVPNEVDDDLVELPRKRAQAQPKDEALKQTQRVLWALRSGYASYSAPELELDCYLRSELARTMHVNSCNMLALHFRRRLRQYIRFRYAKRGKLQLPTAKTNKLVDSCFRVKTTTVVDELSGKASEKKLWDEWDDTKDPVEIELRRWLEKVPWEWTIREHMGHFIRKLHDMQTWMEKFAAQHPKTRGTKLYSLLPYSSSYTNCFITINGSSLHGICARAFLRTGWKLESVPLTQQGGLASRMFFVRNRHSLLREIFSVAQFETRLREGPVSKEAYDQLGWEAKKSHSYRYFADQVLTDGYGASVLLTRPRNEMDPPPKKKKSRPPKDGKTVDPLRAALAKQGPNYRPGVIIGIDPGVRSLCTAVSLGQIPRKRKRRKWLKERGARKRKRLNRRYNRGQKITAISTREYSHLAKFDRFRSWHEDLKQSDQEYACILQLIPSFKTSNYELYLGRLNFAWTHMQYLLDFSAKHAFLAWRFTRLRAKKKALDVLAKRIVPVPSQQVCIAYGDWSRQDGIRGHAHGPVEGFAKALAKRAVVVPMDEFRTSKLCSCCHQSLEQVRLFTKVKKREEDDEDKVKMTKKLAKEMEEMAKFKKPKLKKFKIVLKRSRNVLRCTDSLCKANLWNRDVNAARNMLELLSSELLGLGRIPAFARRDG